ncbi:MAG: IclR family transcriptional regulator [Syntrophomonadaceae bacterium]
MKPSNGADAFPSVQSVERTFNILSLFSEQQPELSLSQISRSLKVSMPAALKHLNALTTIGVLQRDPNNKRYSLGLELIKLGNLAKRSNNIRQVAVKIMTKLSKETGESVHLFVPDLYRYQAVCIESVESPQTVISKVKMSLPLHVGASKKVILAYLDENYLQSFLSNYNMVPYTKNSISDPETLLKELDIIRSQGYATSFEETAYDICAVAAPIFRSSGIAASIAIYIPLYRFVQERMPFLIERLLNATGEISKILG